MGASALFTLALLGFLLAYAAQGSAEAAPRAEVVGVEAVDDATHVRIRLFVDGPVGYRNVEVEVACDDPAPAVTFDNVPARAQREAVVVCPAGTVDPKASVVWWAKA